MNNEYEMSSHENYLKNCIKEKLEEIQQKENQIYNKQEELHEAVQEYNNHELSLENEQLLIKHEHEEQGVKPTQAKEKAKLETRPGRRGVIELQSNVDMFKINLDRLKRQRKLLYAELDFLMLQYQEIVGGCKCNG